MVSQTYMGRSGRSGECLCMHECVCREKKGRKKEKLHVCIDAYLGLSACKFVYTLHMYVRFTFADSWAGIWVPNGMFVDSEY